jgi:hypothetical protein
MNFSHVIIVRAVDEDGASVQMKVCYDGLPPRTAEEALVEQVVAGFKESFGHRPIHMGYGTFPYIEEYDGNGDD